MTAAPPSKTLTGTRSPATTRTIAAQRSCCATWLEARRLELERKVGTPLPRPVVEEDAHATEDPDIARLKRGLVAERT